MVPLLVDVLLPLGLVLGATVAVGAATNLDPRPLSVATFWLFAPCLVLDALVSGGVDLMALPAVLAVPAIVGLVGWGLGELVLRVLRIEARARDALLLAAVLTNAGNLGLPIVTFRWGAIGAATGAVVLVGTSLVSATIGVWIAARGGAGGPSVHRLLRVPVVWAAVLGLGLRLLDVSLPMPVGRAVTLLGGAAIPCMLVVLGLQLRAIRGVRPDDVPLRGLVAVALLKLGAVPLLALGVGAAAGLGGDPLRILVAQHAMPTAVFSIVLATEYDRAPRAAAFLVVATTVVAALTAPLWLLALGR